MSDEAMALLMTKMGQTARPHGFRTSLRSWAADTGQSFDVAEMGLGHKQGNKVERTYQRSDLLERRQILMQRWADVVTGKGGADVVTLSGASL